MPVRRAVRRLATSSLLALLTIAAAASSATAADQWIEVTSPHFRVVSNAGDRSTRKLAWQLEQIRSAVSGLFAWAKVDLTKPLLVIAAKDESSMRLLAPEYWETRGAIRPASVWVSGPDQHYLAIRTDIEIDTRLTLNPFLTAYHSYVALVLRQSVPVELPLWFAQGFTGVLSNTIVRDDQVLVGPPIPFYLETLRDRPVLPLAKLLAVTRQSTEYVKADGRETFDAETWAFVHFLMFADEGRHRAALNAYAKLVSTGTDAASAFAESLGDLSSLELPFRTYISRNLFSYRRYDLDAAVEREKFPVRQLAPAESWSARALFHAAMNRWEESRGAIAEARKADPSAADSYTAEALLLDRAGQRDEARTAYARAAELGTTNAYAHYRLASLSWEPNPSKEKLEQIDAQLARAVAANNRYAAAYAWLGEIRAALGNEAGLGLVMRAIALEPRESSHHARAAQVLLRSGRVDDARTQAELARALAEDDQERAAAQRLLDAVSRAAATPPASTASSTASTTARPSGTAAPASDPAALSKACQSGEGAACQALLPGAQRACDGGTGAACGFVASLYERGVGVAEDLPKAFDLYRQACEAGERRGCLAAATMQARGTGVERDPDAARATLTPLCEGDLPEACTQLALIEAQERTPEGLSKARVLLTKACEARAPRACELLSSMPKAPR
jgi:TPR repeat protein